MRALAAEARMLAVQDPPSAAMRAPAPVPAPLPPLRPRATVGGMWPVLAMRAPLNRLGFARRLLGMMKRVRHRQVEHRLKAAWAQWQCFPGDGHVTIWVELG